VDKILWLDLKKFGAYITPHDCNLTKLRYFTSRVKAFADDPDKPARQGTYLDAIYRLKPLVEITYGNYQAFQSHCRHCDNDVNCAYCGKPHIKPNEKKTDVNIATYMLVDAIEDRCDVQILVSGDGDYENLLKELRRVYSAKELIVAFPPKRKNNKLTGATKCTFSYVIAEDAFKNSQFSDVITFKTKKGKTVTLLKPPKWA